MIRREDLVRADFLLFDPVRDANRLWPLLAQPVVNDFSAESDVISAWLTQDSEDRGLQTVSEHDLRLVRIIDRAKLDAAFGRLLAKHHWRDLFYAENRDPSLPTRQELVAAANGSDSSDRDVRFGDRFRLRGVLLKPRDAGLQMELLWESLAEQPLKYFVFVHLIDPNGKMLAQADYEQSPSARAAPRIAKAGEVWRDRVQLSADQLKGVTGIAFGLWEPPRTFLIPDRGNRDWDNRRLILPVPRDWRRPVSASSTH
jgi:hypothetical protein